MNYFEYIIHFLTNLSKYDRDRNKSTFSTNSSIPNPKTDNPWRNAPRNDSVLTLNFSPNILINDADTNPERWTMPNTNPDWKMFQSAPKRSEGNDLCAVYPYFHLFMCWLLELALCPSQTAYLPTACSGSGRARYSWIIGQKYHLTRWWQTLPETNLHLDSKLRLHRRELAQSK